MSDEVPTPDEPSPIGRSRYEDLEIPEPAPAALARRRTPTVTVAAIVLGFSGALPLLAVALFNVAGTARYGLLALGIVELAAAVLVAILHPAGRPFGIAAACLGIGVGLAAPGTSPANRLVTVALNGFVIYALASSGPSFRRG